VYADASRPGLDETTPVATLDDPASEDVMAHYGALKARCEDEIRSVFGARALIVRPGLIVGPLDPTERFAYWVARFVLPQTLGARTPAAIVPGPPDRAVQFVDARDLATWMLDMAEQRVAGMFDACSPAGTWTFGALVDVLVAAARAAGSATVPRWVDDDALVRHEVTPWTGLPLWIPASDAESAGFMHFACARAKARGLAIRPLERTVEDTAAWLRGREASGAWKNVLSADQERDVLADVDAGSAEPRAAPVRS
jgi:2'-hydroxyisoflavone reductase